MKIENESVLSGSYGMPGGNGLLAQNPNIDKQNVEIIEPAVLKYGGENSSGVSLATRLYANRVIKNALQNIKSGENIYENRRIIDIFGLIVGEKPDKIIYG